MSNSYHARINFGDVINDNLLVSSVGPNQYRLEDAPLLTESVLYGDIIEAEPQADGSLFFTRVLKPSGMRHYDYVLPRSVYESEGFEKLLVRIDEEGGHWTQAFGGVLLVSLPPEAVLDPWGEIEKLQG